MAKDGTMRGGARVGSGRKSKALTEKIGSGLAASVIELPEPEEISGEDVPPVKEFLKAAQKSGIDLCAEDVFKSTFLWLKERGCDRLVNTQLIEQYAMSVSRWVQCETCISEYGFSGEASDHRGGNHFSVCDHEPELFEAGKPVLVPDLSDREGKLLRGVRRRQSPR